MLTWVMLGMEVAALVAALSIVRWSKTYHRWLDR